MNLLHESIFQKAVASKKPEAIYEVARAFEAMGVVDKASVLYQRAHGLAVFAFGAMARGTPVKDTNGAVIPPGRYWLDAMGDKRKALTDWIKSKPEIRVETTEDHADESTLRHLHNTTNRKQLWVVRSILPNKRSRLPYHCSWGAKFTRYHSAP